MSLLKEAHSKDLDTADHFDRDPQPSPIVVDGQAIPEVARVQVPMPAVGRASRGCRVLPCRHASHVRLGG